MGPEVKFYSIKREISTGPQYDVAKKWGGQYFLYFHGSKEWIPVKIRPFNRKPNPKHQLQTYINLKTLNRILKPTNIQPIVTEITEEEALILIFESGYV